VQVGSLALSFLQTIHPNKLVADTCGMVVRISREMHAGSVSNVPLQNAALGVIVSKDQQFF
jgi:uncharacterized membrane protein YecN with MAPEG domain